MLKTFLNFSQLNMSFSWTVNPEKDKKTIFFIFALPDWLRLMAYDFAYGP